MSWNQGAGPAGNQAHSGQFNLNAEPSVVNGSGLSLDGYVAMTPAAATAAAVAASQSNHSRGQQQQQDDFLNEATGAVGGAKPDSVGDPLSREEVYHWVQEIQQGASREQALALLGKHREQIGDLALVLWHSFGTMTILLQELVSVYPMLSLPQLTSAASNRVCNALSLLQCVASHDATRPQFLKANIPMYLYPFLNTTSKTRAYEYLRLTSLGVIGALVKNDSAEVVNFLLSTEIIPLCLRMIETGSELTKTVAIFIVQRIITDDLGLTYVCQTYERFFAISGVLSNAVQQLTISQTGSARLLKHVIRCYLRLSDDPRARESLRQCLPEALRDATFSALLRSEAATRRCLTQLLTNLANDQGGAGSLPVLGQAPGNAMPGQMPGNPMMLPGQQGFQPAGAQPSLLHR